MLDPESGLRHRQMVLSHLIARAVYRRGRDGRTVRTDSGALPKRDSAGTACRAGYDGPTCRRLGFRLAAFGTARGTSDGAPRTAEGPAVERRPPWRHAVGCACPRRRRGRSSRPVSGCATTDGPGSAAIWSPASPWPPTSCPPALGDASLANLPPQAGLYACLFGGLVFWLFCSSRQTTVTVTSAISLLVGASLGPIAGGDPARFGGPRGGDGAPRGGHRARRLAGQRRERSSTLISESVMVGFKCGVALFLASTQLPKLFGFHGGARRFLGEQRRVPPPPGRDERGRARHRRGGAGACWSSGKVVLRRQARGPVRRDRRHRRRLACCGLDARGVKLLGRGAAAACRRSACRR